MVQNTVDRAKDQDAGLYSPKGVISTPPDPARPRRASSTVARPGMLSLNRRLSATRDESDNVLNSDQA